MSTLAALLLICSILLSIEAFTTFVLGGPHDHRWAWGTLAASTLMGAIASWMIL